MREAVIVSTARTALTKAARGAFNNTHGIKLAAHSIEHAIARAGIDPAEVDDVILGNAAQSGTTGFNIARNAALAAGCPVTCACVACGMCMCMDMCTDTQANAQPSALLPLSS